MVQRSVTHHPVWSTFTRAPVYLPQLALNTSLVSVCVVCVLTFAESDMKRWPVSFFLPFACASVLLSVCRPPHTPNCGISYPGVKIFNYRLLAASFSKLLSVCYRQWLTLLPKHLQSSLIIMLITAQWKCLISEHMISLTNEFTVTVSGIMQSAAGT